MFKKLSKTVPIFISVLVLTLCVWAISQQLHKYRLQDIISSLKAIPNQYLIWAIILTGCNYFLLTGYDTLALRYIRKRLSYRRSSLVAIISYGISNSVGFALLSGSAIRYRFYSAWGVSAVNIAHIISFCNLSFWLGLLAVGGIIFTFIPLEIPPQLNLPFISVFPLGVVFLLIITTYLAFSAFSKKPLKIKNWVFPHLSFKLCLAQIFLTSFDWIFASAVLYVLLPVPKHISFISFFGIYLLAQITGIISNVPGGLGIFETVIITLLSPLIPASDLLGVLLAYRGIYYFIPLIVSLLIFCSYELRRRAIKNKQLAMNNEQ